MAQRLSPFTILVKEGGRLIAGGSAGAVGPADYVDKTNFRRLDDAEIRREGELLFRPNTGLPQGSQAFDTGTDVVGLWEAVRPNGDRAAVLLTPTDVYKFDYDTAVWVHVGGPYSSCRDWQVESIDGYLIFNNKIDLPFSLRVEESATVPIYEMRDRGIASVGVICVHNGFLLIADITEIADSELSDWMNGLTPYGVPPSNITNRIRYKIGWSDVGEPRNWAPIITGTITEADKDKVVLDYPAPYAFPVGAKLAVTGAGPNGGVLGGQEGIEDGVVVTAVSGATLTLGTSADVSLTFPLTVAVTRFADVSTFVGSSSIQDDSSAVVALKSLKRVLVVYRETGIWSGRYTSQVETPFLFTPEWSGKHVPTLPRAIADINGDYHVYPSNRRFYRFDGAGEPRIFEPLDDARSLFFAGLTTANTHLAWCTNNPITNEAWFFCPNGVLALDYATENAAGGTASWIDQAYTAAGYIHQPGSDTFWFVLARSGKVLQYGAVESDEGSTTALTYFRQGVATVPKIKFGIQSLNDDRDEKDILSYAPLLATDSEDFDLRVLLSGGDSVARPLEVVHDVLLVTPATLPETDPYYRNIYFQDELQVVDTADVPASIVGRSFRFNRVKSLGVTQKNAAA